MNSTQKYVCKKCGYVHNNYRNKCFSCGHDTLILTTIKPKEKRKKLIGTTIHINI